MKHTIRRSMMYGFSFALAVKLLGEFVFRPFVYFSLPGAVIQHLIFGDALFLWSWVGALTSVAINGFVYSALIAAGWTSVSAVSNKRSGSPISN